MSCSKAKYYILAFTFLAIALLCVLYVKNGGLDGLIYGRDFENNPCTLSEGKQYFNIKIPYKPKSYYYNKLGSKLLRFYKLPELSVCVPKCPDRENTTDLLVNNGYGRLFDWNGGFVCGKVPDYVGPYHLRGERCYSEEVAENIFSTDEVFYQQTVCC